MKTILLSAAFLCLSFNLKSQNDNVIKSNGNFISYHENGKIKTKGSYQNNKKEGEWLYFHDNGNLALKKSYSAGTQKGEWIYYNEKGSIVMKIDDISKVNDNAELSYYQNNQLKYDFVLSNGKKPKNNNISIKAKF